jgi:flagellar motor switch protein FliN/FliY
MVKAKARPETSGGEEEDLDRAISELRGVLQEDAAPSFGLGDDTAGFGAAGFDAPAFDAPAFGAAGMDGLDDEAGGDGNPNIIMNIPVDVQIVLGSAEMQVADLMGLKKGATVALDRRIGEPVDVVVNGRKIARGEITVLDSDPTRFGIRLTEIIAATKKG